MGLSDHFLTYCTRKVTKCLSGYHNAVKIRSLRSYSAEDFLMRLSHADWSNVYCSDIERSLEYFRFTFLQVLDLVAPIREIRLKTRTKPWFNHEIYENIKVRDKFLHDFLQNRRDINLYKMYCRVRNKLQRDIRSAKANYFKLKIEEIGNDSKKIWQELKSLGYSTKDNSRGRNRVALKIDGNLCSDPPKVANHMNAFFTSVASDLVDKLPCGKNIYDVNSVIFNDYYKGVLPDGFQLHTVTADSVFKQLLKLNSKKSTGPDNIPVKFLKDGACVLKDPISFIINLSISCKNVPTQLKCARVRPLYKKGSTFEVGNYRPISILSAISKLLEQVVFNQLEKYLSDNNLIYNLQSGFRSSYSTDTCLIYLTDYIRSQMAQGNYTGMVLLDLQKAFDTVDHGILCQKLQAMGVHSNSVNWFKSYLLNREQIVSVNGVESQSLKITSGVPQGSILGPLLFLCYVNDMKASVNSNLLLYADDSALFVSGRDPDVIADQLNRELESCRQWLIDNKLSLHLGKTEVILFGSKIKLSRVKNFKVSCDGMSLISSKSVKYLGVTLDQSLTGEFIAESVLRKANARLHFLYRHSSYLNERSRRLLCSALIQCHFNYCCSSWFSALSVKLKKRLQVTQNKVVRFILSMDPRAHVGQQELDKLGILNVKDRVTQLKLNHVYKIFYHVAPDYICHNFIKVSDLHNHSTRGSTTNFVVPRIKGPECNSFFYTAISEWNSLANNVKYSENFSQFKRAVKRHLSSQADF